MKPKSKAPNVIQFPVPTTTQEKKPKKKNLRDDGRFCVRVTVTQNGERKQVPFYSSISRADAKEKAEAFKKQIGLGLNPDDRDITVAQWGSRWIAANEKDKGHNQRENYRSSKKFIDRRIGERPIRAVTELELSSLIGDLNGYSSSYINKIFWFLKTLFKSAYRNHIISIDPSEFLSKPKGTYTGHRCLEEWEIALILNHWKARRAGIWMMALLFCGIRRSESYAARLKNFDQDKSEWVVEYSAHEENNRIVDSELRQGKTDAAIRTINIFEPLRSALIWDFKEHPRTYFMENANGSRVTESGYRRSWDQMILYLEKVANGLDPEKQLPKNCREADGWISVHFTAHDLRYTFATFLYDAGVDEKTAQRWMGHESAEMTRDLYAKLTAERQARSDTSLVTYFSRFTQEADQIPEKPYQ